MSYNDLAAKALLDAKDNWEKALLYHTPITMEELVKQYLSTKSTAAVDQLPLFHSRSLV